MLNPVAFSCYKKLNFQKCEDSERTESRKPGKQTKGGFDLARQKDENREKAKQLFLDSDGLMKNTEIAEALGIDSAKVRKWKCVDKWNDALENKPKKRGGQKGNKNANGPIIMVNVLDPAKHLKGAETVEKTLAGGITELPYEAVSDTVEVKGYDGEDSLTETYTRGEDYDLFYTDGVLRLERIESGKIKADNARLNIKFNSVDPSKVTKKEIIGGYDTNTNKSSGFELVDSVYPKYGVIPTLFLAPNFSTDSEVAAIMAAKAENINGLFTGKAIIDADTETVKVYFYCVSRMFSWVANSVILSMWSKVDKKLNKRLIESVTQSINIWLNGLMAEEKILGGRVEFLEEENTTADLLAGKAKFHIYLTPPSPAKELDFVLEYDVSYLENIFA